MAGGKGMKNEKLPSLDDVIRELGVDVSKGLSDEEVRERARKYGYNEVEEKKESSIKRLLKKFTGLTSYMLEVTMALTLVMKNFLDFYVVTALLLLNVVLGYAQEERANRALEALKQKLHVNARALRGGSWKVIPARELVPGDIVRVRAGDFVPADIRILEGDLDVDQSALTGESLPVSRKREDLVYSGSIVRRGEATGIVVGTGSRTYFGRTTELVNVARPKLHMEEVISQVVRWLLVMVVVLLVAGATISVLNGVGIIQVVPLALVLLVSAIPVALPAMFTITMAIGSLELAKKGVLVTRLSASEDAASMDTLCADKTGTITENRLAVVEVVGLNGHSEDEVLAYGALASEEANQDPIDIAFIRSARERGVDLSKYKVKQFIPFDPSTKRTEAVIALDGKEVKVVKGAVNVIMQLCKLDEDTKKKVENAISEMAEKGYRSLAVGIIDDSRAELIGMVGLYDRPRSDSKQLIEELKALGVSVKMLTGDARPIAAQMGRLVGIGDNIASFSELRKIKDEEKVAEVAEQASGFAEIYPEDKYTIVKALQSKGHVVGMTGDGVNDAPALKQAEVGIAVSTATDVAKAAASVVLTREGLINIVDLVKTGRMIYQRIVTWIFNKVVKTFQIVVFVVAALFLWHVFVVNAFDVLLLLFLIDFVTISISTDNVRYSRKPDRWDINWLVKVSMLIGIASVVESLFMMYIGVRYFGLLGNISALNTYGFDILMFAGMLTILVVRERGPFWASAPSRTLAVSIVADIALATLISWHGIPGLHPIPIIEVLVLLGLAVLFNLIINDFIKRAILSRYGTA